MEITKNIRYIGVDDKEIDLFEGQYIVPNGIAYNSYAIIDEKIAMYQEENTKIEEQIAETVKQYQQYETDIFTEVASDSAITLVALYPELKADTLVRAQVDIYIKNNQKIKSLKEDKINGTINKWWLYFGS
jgi:hypothetical protein